MHNSKSKSYVEFLAEYSQVAWLYAIVIASVAESFLVIYGYQGQTAAFFRLVLGLALLGLMPGYSAVRAVFPLVTLTFLERIILSIFLSLMISIGLGTLLGYLFLFQTGTNVLLLSSATILLAFVGGYRTFKMVKKGGQEGPTSLRS